MRRCVVVAAFTLGLAASAAAAPHKVLVLPVDGNADAATRTKLTAHIVRLAKGLDGEVGTAEATFADTALAVGCDPRAPRCSDEVIATLAVDELVWGTATRDGGQTRLVGHALDVAVLVAVLQQPESVAWILHLAVSVQVLRPILHDGQGEL